MKTFTFFTPSIKALIAGLALFISGMALITSTSCSVGSDGRPGLAYVAFEWEGSKPDFIDCGTASVPPNFYYGSYYRINPGWYTAYYEGKIWNGSAWGTYAWEMDYEIWINQGQRGGYGYNGKDGMNTYLNFVCTPSGPVIYRHDAYLRKAPQENQTDFRYEIAEPGQEHVDEYQINEYTIRVTSRSVVPRTNPSGGNHPLN